MLTVPHPRSAVSSRCCATPARASGASDFTTLSLTPATQHRPQALSLHCLRSRCWRRTNNAGPFASGSAASGAMRIRSKPAAASMPPQRSSLNPATRGPSAGGSPRDRAAACRRSAAVRPACSTRAASRKRGRRIRQMVQHEQQRRGIETRRPSSGSASSSPCRTSTLSCSRRRRRAACEHVARTDRPQSRCATNGASAAATWPVPQPRSPTTHRRRAGRAAPGGTTRGRTAPAAARSHCPAADAKNCCDFALPAAEHALQPPASWSAPGVAVTCSRSSAHSRRVAGPRSSSASV